MFFFFRTAWCRPVTQRNTISVSLFCLVECSPLMWLFWAFTCLFLWCHVFDAAWPLPLKIIKFCLYLPAVNSRHRSRCSCALRRGSVAARLLELRDRIPPVAWTFVSCEYFVLLEVSAMGRSLVQRSPTVCLSRSVVRYNVAYEFQGNCLEVYTVVGTRISLYRPRCGLFKDALVCSD